jgi:uncharacterized protein YueI
MVRAKRFEKLLERKRKKVDKAQEKIEKADQTVTQSLYLNIDGTIDWDRLVIHIREALRGR